MLITTSIISIGPLLKQLFPLMNTRQTSTKMSSKTVVKTPSDELSHKIEKSKISHETKEIFKLLLCCMSTLINEKDSAITVLQNKVSSIQSKNEELSEKLEHTESDLHQSVVTLEGKLQEMDAEIKRLKNENVQQVARIRSNIDVNEQYERKDTLIISGPTLPPVRNGEKCKDIVRELLRTHTNLVINDGDISIAHRIGKKPSATPDKRNIIFKLCRRDLVGEIFSACRERQPPFFVNCSLTPTRNKVFYGVRQLKKKFPSIIKRCRTLNGDIVAFVARHAFESSSPHASEPSSPNALEPSLARPSEPSSPRTSEPSSPRPSEPSSLQTSVPSQPQTENGLNENSRNDRRIIINTRESLQEFAKDVLKTDIKDLNINW